MPGAIFETSFLKFLIIFGHGAPHLCFAQVFSPRKDPELKGGRGLSFPSSPIFHTPHCFLPRGIKPSSRLFRFQELSPHCLAPSFPPFLSHLPQSPKDCSIYLYFFCCLAYSVIVTIFLNSIYTC